MGYFWKIMEIGTLKNYRIWSHWPKMINNVMNMQFGHRRALTLSTSKPWYWYILKCDLMLPVFKHSDWPKNLNMCKKYVNLYLQQYFLFSKVHTGIFIAVSCCVSGKQKYLTTSNETILHKTHPCERYFKNFKVNIIWLGEPYLSIKHKINV